MIKKVINCISYLVFSIIILFFVATVGVNIFGIKTFTVLSGSMEPTYKVGSLIYVTKIDLDSLKKGDAITFNSGNVVVTHRIVEVKEEEKEVHYVTKGDANENIDKALVNKNNVIGKPIFTIPYLGYVATFVQTKGGKLVILSVGVVLVTIMYLIDYLIKDKDEREME